MRFFCVLILVLVMLNTAYANNYGVGEIKRFYVEDNGWVAMGLITQLKSTCSNWGEHFRFDGSTPGGKNMLSVIMAAKMADKPVNVWYTDSTNPGTDHTNGCSGSAMSILQNIGIP